MLLEQTLEKLQRMKLSAMVDGVREQTRQPEALALSFEERLGLLVDREWEARENRVLTRRLQGAHLRQQASIEDLEFGAERGLDRGRVLSLAACHFIEQGHHLLITGPTGAGKTYLACALGQRACRLRYTVRYFRCGPLLTELALARADGSYPSWMRKVQKAQLLILDDWGLVPLQQDGAREIFELLEERPGSVIVASQIPVAQWYEGIAAPTLADAILDRLVHNAYKIELRGESRRKRLAPPASEAAAG
jgi:DNA replication protein DnaC